MGWIEKYMQYTANQQAPDQFHFWCAVSALAAVLGRRVWMHRGYYSLFPNHYIILIGISALCTKSTAIRLSAALVEYTGIDVIKEKLTQAYFYKHLASSGKNKEESFVYICASELKTIINAEAYASGLISTMTELYDCPNREGGSRTKTAGVDVIHNPCINIIGAATPNFMSSNFPGDAFEDGFPSRVIFVVGKQPRFREAWPEPAEHEVKLKEELVKQLVDLTQIRGQFKVTPEARELFDVYYTEMKEPEDVRMMGFFGRKGDHILKLAMILSLSEGMSLTVDAPHIEDAIGHIEDAEKEMPSVFAGVTFSKSAKHIDRVQLQLKKIGGWVRHSDLLKKNSCYLNKTEFKEVVDTLKDSGVMEEMVDKGKVYYRVIDE